MGASAPAAARVAVTEGSGSYSTTTRSTPSRATAALSAITMATGSPTKRTTSAGSTGCEATKTLEPSRPARGNSLGLVGTGR